MHRPTDDTIAARLGIGRDEARRRFKTCLVESEERKAGAALGCDTI
jgi:hypothetical protein